jgi:hypothetical protein
VHIYVVLSPRAVTHALFVGWLVQDWLPIAKPPQWMWARGIRPAVGGGPREFKRLVCAPRTRLRRLMAPRSLVSSSPPAPDPPRSPRETAAAVPIVDRHPPALVGPPAAGGAARANGPAASPVIDRRQPPTSLARRRPAVPRA